MTYNHKQYIETLSILEVMRDDAKNSFMAIAERLNSRLIIADGPADLRRYETTLQDPMSPENCVRLDLASGTVRIDNSGYNLGLRQALQRMGVPHTYETGRKFHSLTMNMHFAKKYLETALDWPVATLGAENRHDRKIGKAERPPKPDERWLREHAEAKAARENFKHSR